MRNILKALPLAILVAAGHTSASEYQGDITGALGQQSGDNFDVRILEITGRYHFAPISTDERPLAEADFFARSSYISFGLRDYGDDADADGFVVGGQFVEPETHFILGGEVSTGDLDELEFRAGLYLDEYSKQDASLVFSYSTEDESDTDTFAAEYKTVRLIQEHFVNIEAVISFEDSEPGTTTTFGGSAYYYFDRFTGVGPTANLSFGEDDGYDLGVQGTHALNEQFGFGASFEFFKSGDDDGVRFLAFAQGRF